MTTATQQQRPPKRRRTKDVRIVRDHSGWLTGTQPFAGLNGDEALAVHADWRGPAKLAVAQSGVHAVVDLFISPAAEHDDFCDESSASQTYELATSYIEQAFGFTAGGELNGWQAPSADTLVGWLSDSGEMSAVDQDQNIRLTLKARGRDGQVRLSCRPDQVRLAMPLGRWESVDPQARQAMLDLSLQANSRCRLARVAWYEDDQGCRADAVVDLTGLPADDQHEPLWQGMLSMATASLEFLLRQLAAELEALADPRNKRLCDELLNRRHNPVPRRPR